MVTWLGPRGAPINQALTAAATAHLTPGNARGLQSRWDSIITARALLMAVAVAGLASSAAAHDSQMRHPRIDRSKEER